MSAQDEIQKVATALETYGYQPDVVEDDLLYVVHGEKNSTLTLCLFEPGVVSIVFEDGTEETVNAAQDYDLLVQEIGFLL